MKLFLLGFLMLSGSGLAADVYEPGEAQTFQNTEQPDDPTQLSVQGPAAQALFERLVRDGHHTGSCNSYHFDYVTANGIYCQRMRTHYACRVEVGVDGVVTKLSVHC